MSDDTNAVTGYCVKCKEKGVELTGAAIHRTKKGGYMAKGKCSKDCGTTVCAMMSKDNAEKAIEGGLKEVPAEA